jgi:SAM-dependent methyltransferase
VDQIDATLGDGCILLDYSGGTGILTDRLLARWGDRDRNVLIVDSSAKFLRLAVEKFADDPRVAFRRIHYLKDERRLQTLQECMDPSMLERGVDGIASTNAIHLYYNLEDTLRSWFGAIRPGGHVFVQSGNIENPSRSEDEWIIDNTVHAIHERAVELVRAGAFPAYRETIDVLTRMAQYDRLRSKYFLPVRPLDHYLGALSRAGFGSLKHDVGRIEASVDEWFEFLSAYHEGVLGWVGGIEKIEGSPPSEEAVRDRLRLMREALGDIFADASRFACCWTYIRAVRAAT